ncbi:hypothetical protein FB45DRAFT_1036506 [Roridomyces roridus]|uniref:Uncharacterized protein n=1 Tax=Roridomyces roridus TaxID=1738132 RepID=A0AAD7FEB7_9AGAR|nr:hypothetical protein FB45DRAFT_1036506 [Roridomyces roridus]
MATRYLGPVIIIRRTAGGSYVVAEMDGSVFQNKIAQFRVVPFEQRKAIELPEDIHDLIDLSAEALNELMKDEETDMYIGRDFQFDRVHLSNEEGEDVPSDNESEADLPASDDSDEELPTSNDRYRRKLRGSARATED